jgi:taspase, threonine aspartase, 1
MSGFIAVHSGAGNSLDETKYEAVCKEACSKATEILRSGGSALGMCIFSSHSRHLNNRYLYIF